VGALGAIFWGGAHRRVELFVADGRHHRGVAWRQRLARRRAQRRKHRHLPPLRIKRLERIPLEPLLAA
jgi:hypothetical protein